MHVNAYGHVYLDSVGQTTYCVASAGIRGAANAAMLAPISAPVVFRSPLLTREKNKYGRTIADVLLADGSNVNQKLVKRRILLVVSEIRPNDHALQRKKLSRAYRVILIRSRRRRVA